MAQLTRREVLAAGVAPMLRMAPAPPPVVQPEYERTCAEALVSFPDASGDTDPTTLCRFLDAAFEDIHPVLPSYCRVQVAARREVSGFGELHRVEDPEIEIELWAQDIGEPVVHDGRRRFLVSRRMPSSMGPPSKMSSDRKRVAEIVFGESFVLEAPFVFEGGNLAFDHGLTLVGRNDVLRSMEASRESRKSVLEGIAKTFGGVEVVEMGNETPGPILQHLDQAFVLLGDRTAVACRLEGEGADAEKKQLETYASQLRELGYRVVYLDHSASDLRAYRSSVNVVPFLDRDRNRKRILLPVFPGELREGAKSVDREGLLGKAARAFDLYRELGYEPALLRDVTHPLGGNTHCILNVLS
jgi:hypothetical protein